MNLSRHHSRWSPRLLAAAIATVAGCGGQSGGLAVEVSFESGVPRSIQDQAERVEVSVLGSCADVQTGERPTSAIVSTHVLREGGGPPLGDDLDPGEYALYAVAQDANCAVVAAGCALVIVDPDLQNTLEVMLGSFSGEGCSASQQCDLESGDCVNNGTGGSGGSGGVGGNGGPSDLCVGASDETPCTVDAEPGMCRMGACCAGCWDGATCRPGTQTQNCGTGGQLCEFVPGCP